MKITVVSKKKVRVDKSCYSDLAFYDLFTRDNCEQALENFIKYYKASGLLLELESAEWLRSHPGKTVKLGSIVPGLSGSIKEEEQGDDKFEIRFISTNILAVVTNGYFDTFPVTLEDGDVAWPGANIYGTGFDTVSFPRLVMTDPSCRVKLDILFKGETNLCFQIAAKSGDGSIYVVGSILIGKDDEGDRLLHIKKLTRTGDLVWKKNVYDLSKPA